MIAAVIVTVTLAVPAVARAHAGHTAKAIGTITSVEGANIMVKTTDGKTVMVMMDAKTKITQGKSKVQAGDLKVGDRVVAEGHDDKGMIMATSVKRGTAAVAPVKK